ncbi:MAG: hypothetical protein LBW85_13540 [Deltaproteobacteria bacterium]|jgi:hypothetical protein|nr:hypothetical protein [Deltaproteobacteria bacterium]
MNTLKADYPVAPAGNRSGLILAFALCILVLMSLMGIVILSNTRTELSITGNTRMGREAFNSADAAARMAIYLTRELVMSRSDDFSAIITSDTIPSPAPRYRIYVCPQMDFTFENLTSQATNFDYTERYLDTGAGEGAPNPHIVFQQAPCGSANPMVVANAVVNLEDYDLISAGTTIGGGDGGGGSAPQYKVGIVVSVNARTNESVENGTDSPHSLITIMYRNFL